MLKGEGAPKVEQERNKEKLIAAVESMHPSRAALLYENFLTTFNNIIDAQQLPTKEQEKSAEKVYDELMQDLLAAQGNQQPVSVNLKYHTTAEEAVEKLITFIESE